MHPLSRNVINHGRWTLITGEEITPTRQTLPQAITSSIVSSKDPFIFPKSHLIFPKRPNGDQSWVFFGRTDAKAETPIHTHLV